MRNMKNIILVTLFTLILSSFAVIAQTGKITIRIKNFESSEGKAKILLFSEKEKKAFPGGKGKALKEFVVPIINNIVEFTFNDLEYGKYAISVHHDEDGNNKLNTNWLGIPNEGLGSSRDAKGFMGPPSFEDAVVELNKNHLALTINMSY